MKRTKRILSTLMLAAALGTTANAGIIVNDRSSSTTSSNPCTEASAGRMFVNSFLGIIVNDRGGIIVNDLVRATCGIIVNDRTASATADGIIVNDRSSDGIIVNDVAADGIIVND